MKPFVWFVPFTFLVSCASQNSLEAQAWAIRDFIAEAPRKSNLGGWSANELITFEGQPIPFRSPPHGTANVLQASGFGLTVFPAYSDGEPAAFVITEIWLNHPTPWIQPIWVVVSAFLPGAQGTVKISPSIFPVGVDSTFYSPYWLATYALEPDASRDKYKSVAELLNAQLPTQEGEVHYCPIAPEDAGVAVAVGEESPTHPWLLAEDVGLGSGPASVAQATHAMAYINGQLVPYLGFGADRVRTEGQLPKEAILYTFAKMTMDGERKILPIPAILPKDAFRSSYVRRTDVLLPSGAAVFIPKNRLQLTAMLSDMAVPTVTAEVDERTARRRLGAVLSNAACISTAQQDGNTGDGAFARCEFLDSAAAIHRLSKSLVIPTQTTMAIFVAQVGDRTTP